MIEIVQQQRWSRTRRRRKTRKPTKVGKKKNKFKINKIKSNNNKRPGNLCQGEDQKETSGEVPPEVYIQSILICHSIIFHLLFISIKKIMPGILGKSSLFQFAPFGHL